MSIFDPILPGVSNDPANINAPLTQIANRISAIEAGTQAITPDINGGTVDGAVIGGSTAAAGSFTNLAISGNLSFGGIFRVTLSGNQSISDTTTTILQFNSIADGVFDTVNYRHTPSNSGYWQYGFMVNWAASVDQKTHQGMLYKNGSMYALDEFVSSGTNGCSNRLMCPVVFMNGSTDYVDVRVYQNTGGAVDANGAGNVTSFWGYQVR